MEGFDIEKNPLEKVVSLRPWKFNVVAVKAEILLLEWNKNVISGKEIWEKSVVVGAFHTALGQQHSIVFLNGYPWEAHCNDKSEIVISCKTWCFAGQNIIKQKLQRSIL